MKPEMRPANVQGATIASSDHDTMDAPQSIQDALHASVKLSAATHQRFTTMAYRASLRVGGILMLMPVFFVVMARELMREAWLNERDVGLCPYG